MTDPRTKRDGKSARSRFFLRIAQAGHAHEQKDTQTMPLFPLVLILAADLTLAEDAKHLHEKVGA